MGAEYTKYTSGMMLGDRYELGEKIGEGGMSEVFRARDLRLDRYVAVKILRVELMDDEEVTMRFAGESHAVAMLSHPNIVGVYDVSHNDELEFIVMELIDGITLRQYLDRKSPLPWKEMLHFSKQVAAAMKHAHERGIIHRDIKPQNIMLLKDGTIKVADFGIAAIENELGEADSIAIGSMSYIPPEQITGQKIDARSDIYSFGVVMYEMLTGEKPYTGDTLSEILAKQRSSSYTPIEEIISDIPDPLSAIVEKAFSTDPNDRYSSSSELLEDLENFTSDYIKAENIESYENTEKAEKKNNEEKLRAVEYFKNLARSRRVGFGLGTAALLMMAVLIFSFLWNYWLKDVFSPAVRTELPNFVGMNYNDISKNADLNAKYNFNVDYVINTNYDGGVILSQSPDAGRSLMESQNGIDVDLKVSTGFILTEVPDVTGLDFREAVLRLQNEGFTVETNNVTSSTVEKDRVISTSPAAGEKISAGSTVYVDVSGGEQIVYVKVPNLIGLSEEAAIAKLNQYGLTHAGTERKESDYDSGTVIAQSRVAHAEVQEHEGITITVSKGPSTTQREVDPYQVAE